MYRAATDGGAMTARLYVLDDYRLPRRPSVRRFSKPLKKRSAFHGPDFSRRLPLMSSGRDDPQQLLCEIDLPSDTVDESK
jgi:hypothetical protein